MRYETAFDLSDRLFPLVKLCAVCGGEKTLTINGYTMVCGCCNGMGVLPDGAPGKWGLGTPFVVDRINVEYLVGCPTRTWYFEKEHHGEHKEKHLEDNCFRSLLEAQEALLKRNEESCI